MKIQNSLTNINQYLNKQQREINVAKLTLENLNLSKLEGIQKDIPLFQNTSLEEIKFITKFFQVLNIARGCTENCTFCLRNAQKPLKESLNSINTILWEDFQRFTDGFKLLNERLGFDTLQNISHITLFEDSNMPVARIKDLEGNTHNTKEVVQDVYQKLDKPIVFATSGWNPNDKFSQTTAEEVCDFVKNNPDSAKEFAISVNPFFSTNSEYYIKKVVNAFKTFLPLFKDENLIGSILFKYNYPTGVNANANGHNAATDLYKKIYAELQKVTDSSLEGYNNLKPENVTRPNGHNMIENKGRGQKFFPKEEVEKNNKKLFQKSFAWLIKTPEQKKESAYNYTIKNIDINGNIYLITPEEQMIPTDIKLNYINKDKQTAPIHTDVTYLPFKIHREKK